MGGIDANLHALADKQKKLEGAIERATGSDVPALEKLLKELEDLKKVCVSIKTLQDQVAEKDAVLKCRNVGGAGGEQGPSLADEREKLRELNQNMGTFDRDLDAKKKQLEAAVQADQNRRNQITNLTAKLQVLEQKLKAKDAAKTRLNALQEETKSLQAKSTSLGSEKGNLEQRCNSLSEELSKLKSELRQGTERLMEKQRRLIGIMDALASVNAEVQQYENKLQSQQRVRNELAEIDASFNSAKKKFDDLSEQESATSKMLGEAQDAQSLTTKHLEYLNRQMEVVEIKKNVKKHRNKMGTMRILAGLAADAQTKDANGDMVDVQISQDTHPNLADVFHAGSAFNQKLQQTFQGNFMK